MMFNIVVEFIKLIEDITPDDMVEVRYNKISDELFVQVKKPAPLSLRRTDIDYQTFNMNIDDASKYFDVRFVLVWVRYKITSKKITGNIESCFEINEGGI